MRNPATDLIPNVDSKNGKMKLSAIVIVLSALFADSVLAGQRDELRDAHSYFDIGNHTKAFRLYRKLAEQGNAIAQHSLGGMYFDGLGTAVDLTKAAHWYKKAAQQGSIPSQIELGRILYDGKGAAQDRVAAYVWFDMAARGGNWKAARARNIISQDFKVGAELGDVRSRAERCYASRFMNCD